MKKTVISLVTAAGLLGMSSMAAAEGGFYLGGGALKGSGETTFDSSKSKHDNSGSSFRLGSISENGNRTEVSYSKLEEKNKDSGSKVKISGFDMDFIAAFGSGSLKPLLGLGFGFYTWEDTAKLFVQDSDLKGLSLNLTAGLAFEITKNFELEATYRYRSIGWQEIDTGFSTVKPKTTNGDLYAGILIKF